MAVWNTGYIVRIRPVGIKMKRRLYYFSVICPGSGMLAAKADEPRQLVTVYPRYPEYAAANYIKGLVEVKFDIGADGTVTRIVFSAQSLIICFVMKW